MKRTPIFVRAYAGSGARRLLATTVIAAAAWNVMAFTAPPLTRQAGYALTTVGVPSIPGIQGVGVAPTTGGMPPPGLEASEHPLGTPAAVTQPSNSYVFLNAGEDQVFVSFDPCRPIHYVVRAQNAPEEGDKIIAEAVAAVSDATGFVFVYDGPTSESASENRAAYQPERYGDRWAPVLFAWETAVEEPKFAVIPAPGSGTNLGIGGSTIKKADGWNDLSVTGQVRLNAAAMAAVAAGTQGRDQIRAVIKHELGHVLGLGHVDDPSQLMFATMSGSITDYAPGDLAGLAILGAGKCRPGA